MFECLLEHGCVDLSSSIDPEQYSSVVVAGGSFGDIWRGKMLNGVEVAVKSLRFHLIAADNVKPLKVRTDFTAFPLQSMLKGIIYTSVRCANYGCGLKQSM